ncbi:MAG: family N-acetyltransferase [Phenylobacterium sp.]|nr:family N-acetyltransferase [Phenylobacterium sp.]
MTVEIRGLGPDDGEPVLALHRAAASGVSGLAREADEIGPDYIGHFLAHATIRLGAFLDGRLAGEIHATRMGPRQFHHVVSDLTIAVSPDFQGRGVGAALFEALFAEARALRPAIERVELMVREGHTGALRLYERLGFRIEGRFPRRVRLRDGTIETDLAMAKFLD